jgi:hypothetical protein
MQARADIWSQHEVYSVHAHLFSGSGDTILEDGDMSLRCSQLIFAGAGLLFAVIWNVSSARPQGAVRSSVSCPQVRGEVRPQGGVGSCATRRGHVLMSTDCGLDDRFPQSRNSPSHYGSRRTGICLCCNLQLVRILCVPVVRTYAWTHLTRWMPVPEHAMVMQATMQMQPGCFQSITDHAGSASFRVNFTNSAISVCHVTPVRMSAPL